MGYIGAHGVAALHKHKYSGVDNSIVSKYVLQPFWTWCVNLFPLWMPPNVITLIGSMFLVTSALLGYVYSPKLDSPPPRWVHFAHGILLFLYQTFDAVDGKQQEEQIHLVHWENFLTMVTVVSLIILYTLYFIIASPFLLFVYLILTVILIIALSQQTSGCDALGCAFEALAFGSTAMCGGHTFWFWFISAVPFYFATWEHYFTHTLILPAINGPTEGLLLIYTLHFFTAIVGAEWWAQQLGKSIPFLSWIPVLNEITMYKAALYMMIITAVIPTVSFNVLNVLKVIQARKGNNVQALAMLYPLILLLGGVLLWDYLSPANLMVNYPHVLVMGIGLAFGFLVGRMILAHLCDEPKGLKTNMAMSLIYLPFALANTLTAKLNNGVPLVNEVWVLLGFCVYSAMLYLHFATSVIHEITTALGILCFRITRKEA